MAIKLIKACKDLNIGMSTAVEFFKNIGQEIPLDPNARLDDEQYLLLAKQFNKDMALKIEAEQQRQERERILGSDNQKNINMSTITDRESAYNASIPELLDFLKKHWNVQRLVFEGNFTTEGVELSRLRGLITDVTIEGKHVTFPFTNADFNKISLRKNGELKNELMPGRCRFSCLIAPTSVRKRMNEPFLLTVNLETIRNINEDGSEIKRSNISKSHTNGIDENEMAIMNRLRLDDHYFIGQFMPADEEWKFNQTGPNWIITDLRNKDFTKIEDKERGVRNLSIRVKGEKVNNINKFGYYKFVWTLLREEPLTFGYNPKYEITPIYPQDIVKCLHDSIISYPPSASKKITRMLDTLNKQLTQSGKEVFIYELLQNANDYPKKEKGKTIIPVDVEFYITDKYLIFKHSGEYFNPKNIAAICDINDGEKSDNIEAIGYKGIGFKTVFLDNDYVYLRTGNYSFRFENDPQYPIYTPWQILPVWTERNELDSDIPQIFNRTEYNEFRVKFALRPRDSKILTDLSRSDNYVNLFNKVFANERVILFIPNIRKVSVYFGNKTEADIVRTADSSNWCVSCDMRDDIPESITERINDVLLENTIDKSNGYDKVPEKYLNFRKTTVKFACGREGRTLKTIDEDAHLYCYLPAKKADWGFKFLMNTDMVPNGERDDIEDIELNHEIAKIAGRQFFYWIKELIASGEYELDSIFKLIPDFNDCISRKSNYKTFIEEFRDEFEELIKSEPFIPCINADGEEVDATIDDIINDETGITASNFISDVDFISFSDTGCEHLPVKELRSSEDFHNFLYRYSPTSYDFDFDSLKNVISNNDFVEWLENEDNNANFIYHLLDNEKLTDFSNEEIFVEAGGALYSSENMYVDFDSKMSRIDFLRNYIPYLSPTLREKLQRHSLWSNYEDSYFKEFDAEGMLEEFIIEDSEAMALLDEESNSIKFFKFAAEKDLSTSILEKISFFDEEGDIQTEYEKTYFFSDDVYSLKNAAWIPEDSFYVLSHNYFDEQELNDSLRKKLIQVGVTTFEHGEFISGKLIEDSDFASEVNELITDDIDTNLAFVHYLFNQKELLKDKDYQLKNYVLLCVDKDGDEVYLNKDDVRYFTHFIETGNSSYDENLSYAWISNTMMYALSEKYINSVTTEHQKLLESFLRQSFGVKTFTDKSFWADVVSANDEDIYSSIESEDDALSFLSYLVRNRSNLLDGSISYNELKNIPLLRADGTISSDRSYPIYSYNEVAEDLENRSWYTQQFYLLDKAYSEQLNLKELQLLQIEQFDFQAVLNSLCNDNTFSPSWKDDNIDFWQWAKSHNKDITDYSALQDVCVFVGGSSNWTYKELYIPDAFFPIGEGIESLVKKFDENAEFVPTYLIEEDTEKCKAEWVRFLKKLNAKSNNKDILEHVLENLGDYEDDAVLALLTLHKKEVLDGFGNGVSNLKVKEDKKSQLQQLKVRTRGGDYLTLDECIIIKKSDGDDEAEPFKYIVLDNEIVPEILNANSEIIIKIAESFSENNILNSRVEWADYKIEEYINRIQEDDDEKEKIHVQFVRDLAKWNDHYDLDKEKVSRILFRAKGFTRYYNAVDLTLGSQYKPAYNFEKYDIDLTYLSDVYLTEDNKDIICSLFKEKTDIHHFFEKDDIEFMSDYEFSIYIWTVKYINAPTMFNQWIKDGAFNGVKCIPTLQSTKSPEELYAPFLSEYVRLCDNYTDKMPAINVYSLDGGGLTFMSLPFKTSLDSSDCISYLLKAQEKNDDDTKHREQIIKWLLDNDDLTSQDIDNYRLNPNAKWKNGRGQYAHISSLYAIHPDATQERSIFAGDENIIRTWSFPDNSEQFEKICEILKIKVLRTEDFKTSPVAPVCSETSKIIELLKVRILILAVIDYNDRYAKHYDRYIENLCAYKYYSCSQVELSYGDLHGTVGRTYLDEIEKKAYYVIAWDNNRTYTKFCKMVKTIVGIHANEDICEEVFDLSIPIEYLIDKYCFSLRSEKEFLNYMEALKQKVIAIEEEIEQVQVEEMQYVSGSVDESDSIDNQQNLKHVETVTDEMGNVDDQDKQASGSEIEINEQELEQEQEEPMSEIITEEPSIVEPQEIIVQDEVQDESPKPVVPEKTLVAGVGEKVVGEHYRSGTWVEGYYRADGTYVSGHYRSDAIVSEHISDIPDSYRSTNSNSSTIEENEIDKSTNVEEQDCSNQKSPKVTSNSSRNSNWTRKPYSFTKEELKNMRSNGSPLELTTLPPTDEEIDILTKCGISPDDIADSNYVAQLRLYNNLINNGRQPEESLEKFIQNSSDVTEHPLRDGKYIHTCSAARGVMYISPAIWNKIMDGRCAVCVYYGPHANEFFYIHTAEDLLKLVEKDDIIIKITGPEKVNVVGALYNGILRGVKGTAYTLIRVAAHTDFDPAYSTYVGDMRDNNEDENSNLEEL